MITKKFGDKKIRIEEISEKHIKDVKKFQDFINSLIDENAKILLNERVGIKEERKWVKKSIESAKNKKRVHLTAYDGDEIIASCDIDSGIGKTSHVGNFGISILKDYRRIGLGTYLSREIIELSKKRIDPKLEVIKLSVFSDNKPAMGLYKKIGFKRVGKIPRGVKCNDKLHDEIIMTLDL